ncbi:MAG: hypothetical protein WC223_12525 [Bacteroidales bacterium]|jgi:hypothetical protein
MKITLPNNTEDSPSVWDTEKEFEQQPLKPRLWVREVISSSLHPVICNTEGACNRPVLRTFEDSGLRIVIETLYKYPDTHPASFDISKETIKVEEI